jgi:hypothetical protein
MLNVPNANMFDFDFCNFKCIITSMVQPIIDILSTIIIWISNQLSNIILDFFIIIFLSIDKMNKGWIVVPYQ